MGHQFWPMVHSGSIINSMEELNYELGLLYILDAGYKNPSSIYRIIVLYSIDLLSVIRRRARYACSRYASCYSLYIITRAFGPQYGGKIPLAIGI